MRLLREIKNTFKWLKYILLKSWNNNFNYYDTMKVWTYREEDIMISLLVGIVIGVYAGMILMGIMATSKRGDNIRNLT